MERQWKYVPNTNNEYIVTEDGEVYSYKHEKLHKLSLSLCSQNKYNKGYYKCTLSINNKQKVVMPHRLVATCFVDGYFEGAMVNHKDGNTLNNHYTNLEWTTQRNNVIDGNNRNGQTFTKWAYKWKIVFPNGEVSPVLLGQGAIKNFIEENHLKCKYTMLLKHKTNKGYKLIRVE